MADDSTKNNTADKSGKISTYVLVGTVVLIVGFFAYNVIRTKGK